jgi:creatinine amidohydrolase
MKQGAVFAAIGAMVLGLCLIVTTVLAAPPKGPEISTKGYSIFDETIVDLPWPEVEKLAKEDTIILFPTGVIEEHGPHMGLGVDTYGAYMQSKLMRRELQARGITTLIAPPFYWGVNTATGSFPGSFTSRPGTVKAVLCDALASLKRWGFLNVFFVNHHLDPDHVLAIIDAIKEARIDTGIRAYFLINEFNAKRWNLMGKEYVLIEKSPPPPTAPAPKYVDRHAAGNETSEMAYYFPDHVNLEMAKTIKPTEVTWQEFQVWLEGWTVSRKMTPPGFVGYPATFDPEAGRRATEAGVKRMADVVEAFVKGTYKPGEVMK